MGGRWRTKASSKSAVAVSMTSLPPWGMASREFTARFNTICSSWPGSASTKADSDRGRKVTLTSSPIRGRRSLETSCKRWFRSSTRSWTGCLRLKASNCRVSVAPRLEASRICPRSSTGRASLLMCERRRSAQATMMPRMLLKSWATPPASRPTASIFCACRSWSSARFCSVTSRAMVEAPTISPSGLRMGEAEIDMFKCFPPLVTRTVSKCSTGLPSRMLARILGISSW
jgi:hypothetical protein